MQQLRRGTAVKLRRGEHTGFEELLDVGHGEERGGGGGEQDDRVCGAFSALLHRRGSRTRRQRSVWRRRVGAETRDEILRVLSDMREIRRLDPAQLGVSVLQHALIRIDLQQPRVGLSSLCGGRSGGFGGCAAGGGAGGKGGDGGVNFVDVVEVHDELETLGEGEVDDVQGGGGLNVLRDRGVALLPREEDAAELEGLRILDEARGGVEGEGDWGIGERGKRREDERFRG